MIVGPNGTVVVMTIIGMCLLLAVVMLRRQRCCMNFHHPARHLMILLAKGVLEMVENQEQSEASGTDQRELETD